MNQPDLSEARNILRLVEADDRRVGWVPPEPRRRLQVAWLIAKSPWIGGEFYRATRPAMLAHERLGWDTCVAHEAGEDKGLTGVAVKAIGGQIMRPDVIVVRPIGRKTDGSAWGMVRLIERAHEAGQIVVSDLDDDVWVHEDWTPETRPADDEYESWCWGADGWLVSTEPIAERIRSRTEAPVHLAPNCWDPETLGAGPGPIAGRRLGTRLWLSGRMSGDLALYSDLVGPALDEWDCQFVHIGAEPDGRHLSLPAARLLELPSCTIPELGRILSSTLSIGVICVADNEYNRAKTLTHPVELASAGLPLIIASDLPIYRDVPGAIRPTHRAFEARLDELLYPPTWAAESEIAREWAAQQAVSAEGAYLDALRELAGALTNAFC